MIQRLMLYLPFMAIVIKGYRLITKVDYYPSGSEGPSEKFAHLTFFSFIAADAQRVVEIKECFEECLIDYHGKTFYMTVDPLNEKSPEVSRKYLIEGKDLNDFKNKLMNTCLDPIEYKDENSHVYGIGAYADDYAILELNKPYIKEDKDHIIGEDEGILLPLNTVKYMKAADVGRRRKLVKLQIKDIEKGKPQSQVLEELRSEVVDCHNYMVKLLDNSKRHGRPTSDKLIGREDDKCENVKVDGIYGKVEFEEGVEGSNRRSYQLNKEGIRIYSSTKG